MKRILAIIAVVAMVVLSGYAQDTIMKVKVPFGFIAGQKMLSAGNYEFRATSDRSSINIRNLDTGAVTDVLVMTRLAQDPIASDRAKLTFDEVGGKAHLEAIWPGVEDGYLLGVTKEKHTHRTVKTG